MGFYALSHPGCRCQNFRALSGIRIHWNGFGYYPDGGSPSRGQTCSHQRPPSIFKVGRSVRLMELQSLIGTLQFACTVVTPGRPFLQRIINLRRGVRRRFHHIRLNNEFFNGWDTRFFFLDSSIIPSPEMEHFTDAASTVGFGGYFSRKWFQGRWPPTWRYAGNGEWHGN